MQAERILFVDDEENLLNGIHRQFHRDFNVSTATCGAEGLACLESEGPFAVVVSDLRMPEMDGIQFLSMVRQQAPETVRMMLTGNADVSAAMQAVNEGNIFRFMSKPCPTETLRGAVQAGLDQYRLLQAERELLENTLQGSVRLLTELLSTLSPIASGRAIRVKRNVLQLVRLVSEKIPIKESILWQFELAAMLSQIGVLLLPPDILQKVSEGSTLTGPEQALFDQHPSVGYRLLKNIPRLEPVAEIVALQSVCFDGSNAGPGNPQRYDIPLAARMLKVTLDFDELTTGGQSPVAALAILQDHEERYDPDLLLALARLVKLESSFKVVRVRAAEIGPGMILAEDMTATDGQLLIAKGFELTDSIIQRLNHYAANGLLKEPICVIMPVGLSMEQTPTDRQDLVGTSK